MTIVETPAPASRPKKILGMSAQVAGVVGIVVSLLLVVGVLFGRAWLLEKTDDVVGKIDAGIAKGMPMLETASTRVGDVLERVSAVADTAEQIAADPNPAPALTEALTGRVSGLSERYLDLRATYAEFRQKMVSAFDRLDTIDGLIPAIDLPEGPRDALESLDARIQELDDAVMDLITVNPLAGPINQIAATIAEKANAIEATLTDVSGKIDTAEAGLANVQTEVDAKGDQVKTVTTIIAIVAILGLLYSALLHWVLYTSGQGVRRRAGTPTTGEVPPAPPSTGGTA